MNQEHATAVAAAFTALWEGEFPATARVLGAVNHDNRDYRPDPRSRTAWELAIHLATADIWFMDGIVKGTFALDPEAAKQAEAGFRDIGQVVDFYQKTFPLKLAALRQLGPEQLTEVMDFFGVMQMPRVQWIGFANNHSVHHRGQLAAYLRAMGSRVPNIYGPSADDQALAASQTSD